MNTYIYARADEDHIIEHIDLPEDIREWLKEARALIDCDMIEIVNTIIPDIVLIIDESGRLKEYPKINILGSILYGNPFEPIVGNLIIGRRRYDEIVPLTEQDVSRIMAILK